MGLFKPSERVLEMICSDKETPLIQYEIYPFGSEKEMQDLLVQYCSGVFEKIINFYREDGLGLNEENKRRLNYQGISHVLVESFKNWIDHSPENSNLITGLFLGSVGVCYGFKDGGDFYQKPNIKNQLENKIGFTEFDSNPRGSTCKVGFNLIYEDSDFIEVDSKKGILYIVQLKKNLIAPKGEHGSQYFYDLKKKREKG